MKRYTVGIDFGSLSGRAVLMNADTGAVLASSVCEYAHAVMSESLPSGRSLERHTALQHPADYLEALQQTVREVCAKAKISPNEIVALGFDFTACTMLSLDAQGMPLCFSEEFRDEPHAYVKLWKDHAAQTEADEINRLAEERGEAWLSIYGGKVSSEWMLPKILKICKEAPKVFDATQRFSEAADWIYQLLTGVEIHSVPFAGYKNLWNAKHGYPNAEFYEVLHPKLKNLIGTKVSETVTPITDRSGKLTKRGSELTGLCEGIAVSVPVLDSHASMPTLGLTNEGALMLILGTSACHVLNSSGEMEIEGICGYVYEGAVPKLYTYEAGQACCGDHFAWFVKNGVPRAYAEEAERLGISIHAYLRQKAKCLKAGESGLLALDWFNGNRSVLSDSDLTGMILGMTLRTKPEEIYRALIEATAYGTKMIVQTFEKSGIAIDRIVASGGIAEKDEMLMQIYADVLNRPIKVSKANYSGAMGSAMYAAVAAEIYEDISQASNVLAVENGITYFPMQENVIVYERLYEEYTTLHDYFGKGKNTVMKHLTAIAKGK